MIKTKKSLKMRRKNNLLLNRLRKEQIRKKDPKRVDIPQMFLIQKITRKIKKTKNPKARQLLNQRKSLKTKKRKMKRKKKRKKLKMQMNQNTILMKSQRKAEVVQLVRKTPKRGQLKILKRTKRKRRKKIPTNQSALYQDIFSLWLMKGIK